MGVIAPASSILIGPRAGGVERLLPKVEADHETAERIYDAAIAKLAPLVADAYQRATAVRDEVLALMGVESQRIGSCMNPAILSRESELLATRKELIQKKSPLVQDLEHAQAVLSTYRSGLDYAEQYKKADDIKSEKLNIEYQEGIIRQLSDAIASLDSQLAPINKELEKLQLQKLVP